MRDSHTDIGLRALTGLLGEFRRGNIADPRIERHCMVRHTRELTESWDSRFPGFPRQYFPYTSLRGLNYRGKRDAHLKSIIVRLLSDGEAKNGTLINPACVFGQHARDLARSLTSFRIIATDIDPRINWCYQHLRRARTPDNFTFVKDNVFSPTVNTKPAAIVFFGACGAVSDGAMDYAVESQSPYLCCRTCCHDNIGGNTETTRRMGYVNWFFRNKNRYLSWIRRKQTYSGFYFSDKYSPEHYPRSAAARSVSDSDEYMAAARNSTDSDICRAIIDLDRYLLLIEKGYDVWYQGELFVAQRAG